MSSDIRLVHLVWAPLGTKPLHRFLESYLRYSAGVEHRLAPLFNGFRCDQDLTPWRRALEHVTHEERRLASPVLDLGAAWRLIVYSHFPAFPAPHVRNSCLLVDRDVSLWACDPPRHGKFSAYRLESGRHGLTARLGRMGLRSLVAGRDGRAYEPPEWPANRSFWQGGQENLLVGDNQTSAYPDAHAQTRQVLSEYAWGLQADPAGTKLAEVT